MAPSLWSKTGAGSRCLKPQESAKIQCRIVSDLVSDFVFSMRCNVFLCSHLRQEFSHSPILHSRPHCVSSQRGFFLWSYARFIVLQGLANTPLCQVGRFRSLTRHLPGTPVWTTHVHQIGDPHASTTTQSSPRPQRLLLTALPALLAAILYLVPDPCPPLAPSERPSTNHARFLRQVRLLVGHGDYSRGHSISPPQRGDSWL